MKNQLNPQSKEKFLTELSTAPFLPLYVTQAVPNYLLRSFSPQGVFPFADLSSSTFRVRVDRTLEKKSARKLVSALKSAIPGLRPILVPIRTRR